MKSGGRTYGKIIGSYKINVLRKKYPESTKLEQITFLNISAWKMSDLYIYIANLDLPHVNAFRKRATPIHLLIVFDRSSSEVVASEITWHASSVEFSRVWLFVTPWTAAHQASLSITNSWSFLKFMSIELVLPSSHFILCHPLILPPSIFPSIRVFSNESVLRIRWPNYWSFWWVLPMNIQDLFPLR